jgi:hypothetical protein
VHDGTIEGKDAAVPVASVGSAVIPSSTSLRRSRVAYWSADFARDCAHKASLSSVRTRRGTVALEIPSSVSARVKLSCLATTKIGPAAPRDR